MQNPFKKRMFLIFYQHQRMSPLFFNCGMNKIKSGLKFPFQGNCFIGSYITCPNQFILDVCYLHMGHIAFSRVDPQIWNPQNRVMGQMCIYSNFFHKISKDWNWIKFIWFMEKELMESVNRPAQIICALKIPSRNPELESEFGQKSY